MKILVTGAAGFIGFHLVRRLIAEGHQVVGIDSLNDYYDLSLKFSRLIQCGIHHDDIEYGFSTMSEIHETFSFIMVDCADRVSMARIFGRWSFDTVIHLAAQAGVRYSIENPYAYCDSNLTGFMTILEGCRQSSVKHLLYASSSSVYGNSPHAPLGPESKTDNPASFYAATKRANELMAASYANLYSIKVTGLRFFTVYGPWGRPDMAYYSFTEKIRDGEPITLYNGGNMSRDFTYIDDIIDGIIRLGTDSSVSDKLPLAGIYNIGNGRPVTLHELVQAIELALGIKAIIGYKPLPAGDVITTWADLSDLESISGFRPATDIRKGIAQFVEWITAYSSARRTVSDGGNLVNPQHPGVLTGISPSEMP